MIKWTLHIYGRATYRPVKILLLLLWSQPSVFFFCFQVVQLFIFIFLFHFVQKGLQPKATKAEVYTLVRFFGYFVDISSRPSTIYEHAN